MGNLLIYLQRNRKKGDFGVPGQYLKKIKIKIKQKRKEKKEVKTKKKKKKNIAFVYRHIQGR